jgi:hypothetical protein
MTYTKKQLKKRYNWLVRIGLFTVFFLVLSTFNSYLQVNNGIMGFWESFFYPTYMLIRFAMAVVFSFMVKLK